MRLDAALAQHKIHIITLPSGYSSSYDREKGSRIISSRAAATANLGAAAAAATAARLAKASQLDGAYPTTTC